MSSKEHEKVTWNTDVGQKAKVEREELPASELTDSCNQMLRDMGKIIGQADPSIRHLTYQGTVATHIYASENIVDKDGLPRVAFFHHTSTLGNTSELVAATAGQDTLRAIARKYGRVPPKLRSGF